MNILYTFIINDLQGIFSSEMTDFSQYWELPQGASLVLPGEKAEVLTAKKKIKARKYESC